ncbi:hypothetical protein [Geoalkalibacter subterraneus]|uniref:Uncharacterized protein n=1 Tax=Geoalkalibacter subterraneus TaxID=483547 RepID=A0A0B5FVQ1_9BACT|nr:hypothetical protein [Geoalkalibacter subterraneus]AJF08235.1 hypothetical protein GSUB_17270 [Geoalkalibacter subterraneus]
MPKKPEISETMTPAKLRNLANRKKWRTVPISEQGEPLVVAIFTQNGLPAYFFRLEFAVFHLLPPASRLKQKALREVWHQCRCAISFVQINQKILLDVDLEYPRQRRSRYLWYRYQCPECGKNALTKALFDDKIAVGESAILKKAEKALSISDPQHKLVDLQDFYNKFWPQDQDMLSSKLESDNPLASLRLPPTQIGAWF